MDWTYWGLLLALGFIGGITGACLYLRWAGLRQAAIPYWLRLRQRLQTFLARRKSQPRIARPAPRPAASDEVVVLIPDGRPWPLGPALQLLELAWRWQVVHGTNLPLRARQGEGAYVWRPPLPSRSATDRQAAEAER